MNLYASGDNNIDTHRFGGASMSGGHCVFTFSLCCVFLGSAIGARAQGTSPERQEVATGDANCDGIVDKHDIGPFVRGLLGSSEEPICNVRRVCDFNGNNALDFEDLDALMLLLELKRKAWQALRIGPIPGLTVTWHASPLATAIPIGTEIEFSVGEGTPPEDASFVWEGAAPEFGGRLARARFSTPGLHVVSAWLDATVDSHRTGTRLERHEIGTSYFVVLDIAAHDIDFRIANISVPSFDLTENASNEETMRAYFGQESIASLIQPYPGVPHHVTSVDRTVSVLSRSNPPGFAELAELCVDAAPVDMGVWRMAPTLREPRDYLIESGSPGRRDVATLTTYHAILTSHQPGDSIRIGEPVTFTARTSPPGWESNITWLSSTKYGSAEPTLGRGPAFTVTFDHSVYGPDGTFWIGVRADDNAFGEDGGGGGGGGGGGDGDCDCDEVLGFIWRPGTTISVIFNPTLDALLDVLPNGPAQRWAAFSAAVDAWNAVLGATHGNVQLVAAQGTPNNDWATHRVGPPVCHDQQSVPNKDVFFPNGDVINNVYSNDQKNVASTALEKFNPANQDAGWILLNLGHFETDALGYALPRTVPVPPFDWINSEAQEVDIVWLTHEDASLCQRIPWQFDHTIAVNPALIDFYSVMLHELGHLLGLNHSTDAENDDGTPNEDQVMRPQLKPGQRLKITEEEIECIRHLY